MKWVFAILAGLVIAVALTPRDISTDTGFPRKPVSLIVAYSPGGAVDTVARIMAKHLEPFLGQRVVVRNKPGAGGEIGYRSLATSSGDGYTLGMITAPPVLMLDMRRAEGAQKIVDFDVLASVQKDPVLLVVGADDTYTTLDTLLQAATTRPDQINVAGDGPLSNNQLQLAAAEDALGVRFNFVPFNGSGPSLTALLGGQVEAAVPSASSATPYVRRGDVRALAVFATKRYPFLPDVPTVFEASGVNVPDIGAAIRGVVVPKGVPEATKQMLTDAIRQLMQDQTFIEHAHAAGLPLHYMGPAEFSNYMADLDEQLELYMPMLMNTSAATNQ